MFVYPGVWKDTPRLNDIRVGLGDCMRYDDISVKTAAGIMEKWRAYRDAPSDLCRQFIALHWYYSDCEDEEAGVEMDRIEQEELDIPDLRWLMKYSGNNPWKKRLQDRIRELEENGLEILE